MHRKILSNLFILISLNLLIKPFWILGIDRTVQNLVGNEQYGMYANLFAISVIFGLLLDFGLNNYNSSQIAKNKENLDQSFSNITGFKLIATIFYFVCTLSCGYLYGLKSNELWLLFVLGINQSLSFFVLFFRSNISGLQYFKTDSLLSISDRFLMIIFMGYLIWFSGVVIKIEHFVYAQTTAYALAAAISFLVLKPHLKVIKISFSGEQLMSILKHTFPYALLGLLMILYTKMDVVLLKKIVNDTENGIYASANRLLEASNMFAAMVASMLLSLFSKNIANKTELQSIIKISTSVLLIPAIMLAVFCHIYKNEIMTMLSKNSTPYSSEIFGIVILSFVPMCLMYIFGTLLTANGNLKILNITAAFTLLLNLFLNSILITKYGAWGAAITAVITQTFFAICNIAFAKRMTNLKITGGIILKYLFFSVLYILITSYIHQSGIKTVTSIFICSVSGFALMLALRIVNFGSILKLLP